jgi:hypothetical protein
MKRIALVIAVLVLILARPAHADTMQLTWQSQTWTKTYDSPTHFTISGPFASSGEASVTLNDIVVNGSAARTLSFGAGYGGTFLATGDGTYNGPMSFPTSTASSTGLGILTPTADGFTLVVNRAASGPDAGATFVGIGTQAGAAGPVTATEPGVVLGVAAALAVAAHLASRSRPAS